MVVVITNNIALTLCQALSKHFTYIFFKFSQQPYEVRLHHELRFTDAKIEAKNGYAACAHMPSK